MFFYKNWEVLQNVGFTEQCFATASDFQWHFQCITSLISDKSVQSQLVVQDFQKREVLALKIFKVKQKIQGQ